MAPTAPVSVARCKTYLKNELLPAMSTMFDQIGGLGRLVKGKTVGIKINLTGAPGYRLDFCGGDTHFTSPDVLATAVHDGKSRSQANPHPGRSILFADPVEEFSPAGRLGTA